MFTNFGSYEHVNHWLVRSVVKELANLVPGVFLSVLNSLHSEFGKAGKPISQTFTCPSQKSRIIDLDPMYGRTVQTFCILLRKILS